MGVNSETNSSKNDDTSLVSRNSSSNEGLKYYEQSSANAANQSHSEALLHQALSMDDDLAASRPPSYSLKHTQFTTSNFTKLAICILVGGVFFGLALPKNQNLPSRSWQILSSIIGYTYFLAWSTSFYPQIFLNHERKTTHGLSVDFCVLNVLGYVCYTAYTTNFYFNKQIIAEYKDRMSSASSDKNEAQITVQGNDVAFAIHAVIMASVTLSQIGIYDSFAVRPPSRRVYFILLLAFSFCAIYIGGTWMLNGQVDFLGFLYVLGSIKIGVTIGKYVPQALLNQSRRSTVGWNVWNVILDLTGGVLSFLQLIGDCAGMNDWSGITGNPAKMALSVVTISFDIIFLVQHYILYPDAEEKHSYLALPMR